MKKFVFILVLMVLSIVPVKAGGWDDNITGGGVGNSSGVECDSPSIGACYTKCNLTWFNAFRMSLVYYDGSYRQIGNTIKIGKYRSGNISPWLRNVIPDIQLWGAIPSSLHLQSGNLSAVTKQYVLSDIRNIIAKMGVNYDGLINDIKTGKYPAHQRMGTNGVNTKGVRLIVEPLFTYATTGACPSIGRGQNYYATLKGLAELVVGRSSGGKPYLWDIRLQELANSMKLVQSDIGYTAYSGVGNGNDYKNIRAGFGMGIFSPFDDVPVDTRCNPGSTKASIQACCSKYNINAGNTANNNTTNLTRPITSNELSRYCPIKCNPNTEGVETCCHRWGITPTDRTNNNTFYLTRPLTDYEINNSTCNPNYCQYKLTDTTKDNCNVSTTGYISDSDNEWRCIFRSTRANFNEVKTHFKDMTESNDYCSIFCNETIKYDLPQPGISTYSGRYLVVQPSSIHAALWPIQYSVSKECRTTNIAGEHGGFIDVQKFVNNMNANEPNIKSSWDNYRVWQTKQLACDRASYTGSSTHTHCDSCEGTRPDGTKYTYSCNCRDYSHSNYGGGKASYDGQEYSCSYSSGHCYSKPNYSYQISSAYNSYQSYMNNRNSMLGQINKCNNYRTTESFEPKLKLKYSEPIYGKEFDLETSSTSENRTTTYYTSGDASGGGGNSQSYAPTGTLQVYSCNNTNCRSKVSQSYPSSKWVKYTYSKSITYKLKDNVYKYVSKYSGRSFDTTSQAGTNYISMGLNNLPIHFSTLPGNYDFNVKTSTYGSGNRFDRYAFGGNTFAGRNYNVKKQYNCEYNVSCERVVIYDQEDCDRYRTQCPDQYAKYSCGSEVQFRPVSLKSKEEAFPGRNGTSRRPGHNWNNDANISTKLTNARGVENYDIYKLSPMYEVTLTPKLMKKIREYNKEMNRKSVTVYEGTSKPTTGVAGYTSMDGLTCSGGTNCISRMIRTRDWNVRGCAIRGQTSGYTDCRGVTAW